ncbi:hypothetical protein HDV02_003518 [Globomyces sp. JEL0801]|nr:hypothetical protein HDV02_003518 [Globomyces sp. JEL0801]
MQLKNSGGFSGRENPATHPSTLSNRKPRTRPFSVTEKILQSTKTFSKPKKTTRNFSARENPAISDISKNDTYFVSAPSNSTIQLWSTMTYQWYI